MGEQMTLGLGPHDDMGIYLSRLTLAEFRDRVRNYIEAIASSQDDLQTLKILFSSGQRVWPYECENAIQSLISVHNNSSNFHAFIERTTHLPLAVVPLRIPILIELKDINTQISKLNDLLSALRDEGWTALKQPTEQRVEIHNELNALRERCQLTLVQVNVLLDRARFKEREYSSA